MSLGAKSFALTRPAEAVGRAVAGSFAISAQRPQTTGAGGFD